MQRLLNLIVQPNWRIIFYDLVRSNQLDIWNINIVKLTDLYLNKIRSMEDLNLLVPANALLVAAILLKLKASTLKLTTMKLEEDEPLEMPNENNFVLSRSIDLEAPVRLKEGQVSLDELIDVVDYIMNKPTKKNIEKQLSKKKILEFIVPKKTENINERTEKLYSIIKTKVDSEGCAMFSRFKDLTRNKFELVNDYFLPLLFLSKDNKINIWQDDFFSDIFIKII